MSTLTIARTFECQRCGLEFEYRSNVAPTRCAECKKVVRRERNANYYRRVGQARDGHQATVVLPDGHPVLPLLAETVTIRMTVRELIGAFRVGRRDDAADALARLAELVNG